MQDWRAALMTVAVDLSTQEVGILVTILLFAFGHLFLASKWAGEMRVTITNLVSQIGSVKSELEEIRKDLGNLIRLEERLAAMDKVLERNDGRLTALEEKCKSWRDRHSDRAGDQ